MSILISIPTSTKLAMKTKKGIRPVKILLELMLKIWENSMMKMLLMKAK